MNKTSYLVISADDGGLYAYVKKWHNSNNLVGLCADDRIKSVNICDTKKEAEKIAVGWNECYKRNGTAPEWAYPIFKEVTTT